MPLELHVVEVNKSFSDYSEKLIKSIRERGLEVETHSFNDYKKMNSLSFVNWDDYNFIFIGTNSKGESPITNITSWEYDRFGCRIGWKGNKCVIFARDSDLPYADYNEFINYCKVVQFDHPDVIVPPENPFTDVLENAKKFLGKKDIKSVQSAQYSTTLHEFMDNYIDKFINCEDGCGSSADDNEVPPDIEDVLKSIKATTSSNLNSKQAVLCHAIIHSAAIACSAIAFLPIPVADTIPITSAQIAMVIGLGKVFKNKLTKSDAQILLKTAAAPLVGRTLAKTAFIFVPGIGWVINGAIAGAITEILGWIIVNDFAAKQKSR